MHCNTPKTEPYTRGLIMSRPCCGTQQQHRLCAFNNSSPSHMRCSGVMTPGGRPSTTPLHRKLAGLRLGGFLLGTEVPAASYATYDVLQGAEALRSIMQPQHVAPTVQGSTPTVRAGEAQKRAVRGFASEHEPHVKTLAFPPPELTLLALHRFLAEAFPDTACARWDEWRVDTPASRYLQDEKSCSMALRFLQHYIDRQQGAVGKR